ncbi:MAG TPA: YbaN family protein [Burkholderiales bacterium]
MKKQDYSAEVTEHQSPFVRILLLCVGSLFVILGVIGLFLPVMPTTVFLLLAAACYARGSKRFYNLLLNSPAFGPAILEWRRHRSIPRRTKLFAIAATVVSFVFSIVLFVRDPRMQAGMAAFGIVLVIFLYSVPSRDSPRGKP